MNLKQRLVNINKTLGTVSENKVDLAVILLETKASEYWKDTSYGGWQAFCSAEVALSYASVFVYVKTAELAKANKFRLADMKHIVAAIGWSRFRVGMTKIDPSQPVNVVKFIKLFKNLNLNERVTYGKNEEEKKMVDFKFSIPQATADLLTRELVIRGMRITNKSRTNASSAMTRLVNELVEPF